MYDLNGFSSYVIRQVSQRNKFVDVNVLLIFLRLIFGFGTKLRRLFVPGADLLMLKLLFTHELLLLSIWIFLFGLRLFPLRLSFRFFSLRSLDSLLIFVLLFLLFYFFLLTFLTFVHGFSWICLRLDVLLFELVIWHKCQWMIDLVDSQEQTFRCNFNVLNSFQV